ncbi:MAG TPA: hypothetical protein VIS48_12975 [Candidatus Kryptonia bacterium]
MDMEDLDIYFVSMRGQIRTCGHRHKSAAHAVKCSLENRADLAPWSGGIDRNTEIGIIVGKQLFREGDWILTPQGSAEIMSIDRGFCRYRITYLERNTAWDATYSEAEEISVEFGFSMTPYDPGDIMLALSRKLSELGDLTGWESRVEINDHGYYRIVLMHEDYDWFVLVGHDPRFQNIEAGTVVGDILAGLNGDYSVAALNDAMDSILAIHEAVHCGADDGVGEDEARLLRRPYN